MNCPKPDLSQRTRRRRDYGPMIWVKTIQKCIDPANWYNSVHVIQFCLEDTFGFAVYISFRRSKSTDCIYGPYAMYGREYFFNINSMTQGPCAPDAFRHSRRI
ncbi:hypothetical protein S101446_00892 [Komagataeibacter europaeus]|nr:hypothetical protein S101446_00892 [Komagataeibacter europaeus]